MVVHPQIQDPGSPEAAPENPNPDSRLLQIRGATQKNPCQKIDFAKFSKTLTKI
jgi:hypothetical protein